MIAEPLSRSLEATGYLSNGEPAAPTVILAGTAPPPRLPTLNPDAWWRSGPAQHVNGSWEPTNLTVLFKFAESTDVPVADWHRDAWNLGCAPLLWVVLPDRTKIYDGFAEPRPAGPEPENLIRTFGHSADELSGLNDFAGRLAMETGQFWKGQHQVDRRNGVDRLLLRHLGTLERELVVAGLDRDETQALIGRTIFAKYLLDREIVTGRQLRDLCDYDDLHEVLEDRNATQRFFDWLRDTFNGDMFPETLDAPPAAEHLARVASFLRADQPDGQMSLFPYRFDVIPVELISSIYERFVHSSGTGTGEQAGPSSPKKQGVYYTPLAVVSLVLNEVFQDLSGDETVIDLTCGSGVFLVEALRRLVRLKANGRAPTREEIRKALYEQVFGVDISPPAVQIAAFSLYLAALELDPDPKDPKSRKFEPLVGRTLLAGDAYEIECTEAGRRVLTTNGTHRKFDVILGNPPWTYKGKAGTAARRAKAGTGSRSPRGEGMDFVRRGMDFAHTDTRFGILLSATPFFARSATGLQAAQDIVESLVPVTMINLSEVSNWLFDRANMPAMALLARHRKRRAGAMELVQVRRSPEGDRSNTLGVAQSDLATLPLASWRRNQGLLKAALLGGKHDLLLLDSLCQRYRSLKDRLTTRGTRWASGLKFGNRSRDASFLTGLPFVSTGVIDRFTIPEGLPDFKERSAQWPRTRDIYRAPLLLINEYLRGGRNGRGDGRSVVAVAEEDIVYKDAYFGASFSGGAPDIAYLIAGILSSAVASWYFLMTSSNFGVWHRNLRLADIATLPTPGLEAAIDTVAGTDVIRLVRRLHGRPPKDEDWRTLDEAVFDLYELDEEQRIIASDGRLRATWQWKAGRSAAAKQVGSRQLREYASAFLRSMDAWLHAANERRFRAEIFDTGSASPVRVIRFALEDHAPPSHIVMRNEMSLPGLLADIDARLGTSIAQELIGARELRIHAPKEVVVVKPAARRFWLGVAGLDDARAVLAKSFAADIA